MPMVDFVLGLGPCQLHFRCIDNHDKVAGVLMRRIVRSVLSAQNAGRT